MAKYKVQPSGRERFFPENDIIVSKTDLKGHITYANRVFLDIAGLGEDEALGEPHCLIRHPDIADAAVVGVPNEDWGEEIKAVVELKPGVARSAETMQSILDFAKDKLPGFQRPRTIDFVDTLPRNAAGKVLRAQVRAPYWAGRSKSI